MTSTALTTEVALFLLVTGLLGTLSAGVFRFAASQAPSTAVRLRDARRIRSCQRMSTAVLGISLFLVGVGALTLSTGV
jgi:hypothetical protein